MLDLGIERFRLAEALAAVLAVRVVPRLCPRCRKKAPLDATRAQELGMGSVGTQAWEAEGCASCHKTGRSGTTLAYEILVPDAGLRDRIREGADATALAGAKAGMTSLKDRILAKVRSGETSVEDAIRAMG